MIVTTLMGGLGNQLFQYAAGRALAIRTGRRLVLDATRLPSPAGGAVRPLDLDRLPIPADVRIVRRPGSDARTRPPGRTVLRLDHHLRRVMTRWTVTDPEDRDVLVDLTRPPAPLALLFGYWQSHRYHEGAEAELRRELTPRLRPDDRVARIVRGTEGSDPVTVHVRRGDYVMDPRITALLGPRPVAYYDRAIAHIAERVDRPVFLVLSDDPSWAAAHLRSDVAIQHVELDRPLTSLEALTLMTRSRHAVISNSSLSWWGARLSDDPDRLVVAPERWFDGRPTDPDLRLPPAWVRLS